MIYSIGIIAMNEQDFLPLLLEDILKQDFNLKTVELILVDSDSTDATLKLMEEFRQNNFDIFRDIKIRANKNKIQSSGWNVVIDNFTGDSLTRLDAHSRIPTNFLRNVASALGEGEKVVGGPRPNVLIRNPSSVQKVLYIAENLRMGSGISSARRKNSQKYVNSMFHATYLREVIDETGYFNEQLLRTEDNEYHYRVRKSGYKLYFTNSIISYQYARPSLKGYFKQKYGNGYWIGITSLYNKEIIEWYHLIPMFFVIFLLLGVLLIQTSVIKYFFLYSFGCYILALLVTSIVKVVMDKNFALIFLPMIVFLTHFLYGVGTLVGMFDYTIGRIKLMKWSVHDD